MIGGTCNGNSNSQSVTGVPDPCGHRLGEPHLRPFQVIW